MTVWFGTAVGIHWALSGCSQNEKLNALVNKQIPPIGKEPLTLGSEDSFRS